MFKILIGLFLVSMLFSTPTVFSQYYDTAPTITVKPTSSTPFVYKDQNGYTIVVGEVTNSNKLTSVSNVVISVRFYDDASPQPIDVVSGETALQVIPPLGKSPYMIKSSLPDPKITQASVSLEGFSSSPSKEKKLTIESGPVILDGSLKLSGILKNTGNAPITDTSVFVALYDAFEPPRIIGLYTISVGSLVADENYSFDLDEKIDPRAKSLSIFSESDVFYSDFVTMKIPESSIITKLVTISDVSVVNMDGNKIATINTGEEVLIKSQAWIQYSESPTSEINYIQYIQIKHSERIDGVTKTYVDYIGTYEGAFVGANKEFPSVSWTPQNSGIFFIESYVWDNNNIPLADPGPVILVVVN